MEKSAEYLKRPVSTAREERVEYDDGTIAFVFTEGEEGGDVFFDGPHTYIPRTPQSPRVSETMILETVDGTYAIGRGALLDGKTGLAHDISQVGNDFPDKVAIGHQFEVPGVLTTPEVTVFGVEYSMSYFNPGNLDSSEVPPSPFQEAAEALGKASRFFDEEVPGRQGTVYDAETGEAYIKRPESQSRNNKSESLLRRLGRAILSR